MNKTNEWLAGIDETFLLFKEFFYTIPQTTMHQTSVGSVLFVMMMQD